MVMGSNHYWVKYSTLIFTICWVGILLNVFTWNRNFRYHWFIIAWNFDIDCLITPSVWLTPSVDIRELFLSFFILQVPVSYPQYNTCLKIRVSFSVLVPNIILISVLITALEFCMICYFTCSHWVLVYHLYLNTNLSFLFCFYNSKIIFLELFIFDTLPFSDSLFVHDYKRVKFKPLRVFLKFYTYINDLKLLISIQLILF